MDYCLALNTMIECRIDLYDDRQLKIKGKVVRVNQANGPGSKYELGISFCCVSHKVREDLIRFIFLNSVNLGKRSHITFRGHGNMDSNTYITLFIEEAKEHIQILNDNLLKLETANENNEPLNEVFRAAHTLKGMAGTLGFEKITNIAHAMENVLDDIRNHKMEITGPAIDILLECTDAMEALVQDILELGGEGQGI